MRWAGLVACKKESRGSYRFLVGRPEVKSKLKDTGVDVRIILKWIFKKLHGEAVWIYLAE